MKLYRIKSAQYIPIGIKEGWDFFSNPQNLPRITPPSLRLQITSELLPRMYPGMIITYNVSPVMGIRMTWVTEITHVDEPNLFIDQQRIGPYRFWHHQHLFQQINGGIEMHDIVHYALPLGPIGEVANRFMVKKQLSEIFNFRRRFLEETFGTMPGRKAELEIR